MKKRFKSTVTPEVGPSVPAGTAVTYTMTVANADDARCPAASFSSFISPQQSDFIVEPQSADFVIATGETFKLDVSVTSGADTEAGNYVINFFVVSNDNNGGFFGGPVVSAPGGVVITAAGAGGEAVAVPAEQPIPPPPSGFINIDVQFVVAEPTGCHVSSARELMIRDISVVEDTCNGCHGAETQTAFLQISPRLAGEQSTLSGFLTGITAFDPVSGMQRRFSELARRRGLLEALVCDGQP